VKWACGSSSWIRIAMMIGSPGPLASRGEVLRVILEKMGFSRNSQEAFQASLE
jgi:hypothetical protein